MLLQTREASVFMTNRMIVVAVLVTMALPIGAYADENLPWLNKPAVVSKPAASVLPWENAQPKSVNTVPVIMHKPAAVQMVLEDTHTRELDDRKLNALAVEYFDISPTSKNASTKLAALQKRVKDFRKALETRNYDTHDLVADVSGLEARIASAKQKALAAQPPSAKADEAAARAMKTIKKIDAKSSAGK